MFDPALITTATNLLSLARANGVKLATAESCTGGLISGLLTEVAGSSDVFDRGFVTYSNPAKMQLLGVPDDMLRVHGAVSAQVAEAMVSGALARSEALVAVAVTGVAGPGGGSSQKPVGTVHMAAQHRNGVVIRRHQSYGDIGRAEVRMATVRDALSMLDEAIRGAAKT